MQYPTHVQSSWRSDGIPEIRIPLEDLLATIGLCVFTTEVDRVDDDDDDDEDIAGDTAIDARVVMGAVLGAKDERTRDSTNAPSADQRGRTKRPLPVSSDVVGLVCHTCRDPTLGARAD